jgi:hypothetical protein
MKTTYTFEKSFGPAASFAGILIFIAGIITAFYSLTSLALVIIGAFIGFTNTSTTIDSQNKRVRFTNNIFGIIRIGKWIPLHKNMKIEPKQEKNLYRTYSRSNQTLDIKTLHKKLYLLDKNSKPLFPVRELKDNENTRVVIDELYKELGIPDTSQ